MAIGVTVEHTTPFSETGTPPDAEQAWDGTGAHTATLTGLGAGVSDALEEDVGSAGAVVVNGGALGTPSSGTLTNATGLPVGGISATGTPDSTTFLRGDGTWNTPAGGSSTWDTIGAAAGDGSTANGDNNIVYQVAKTTNTEISFRFTESAAATNGTSTSGVPNQVLLQLDTVAASTMSPLKVLSRGSLVFAISPTTPQFMAVAGTASAPGFAFINDLDSGITSFGPNFWALCAGGAYKLALSTTAIEISVKFVPISGSASSVAIDGPALGNSGFFFASGVVATAISGVENNRVSAGSVQYSKGTADAVSYALNARKSRGTVASPTVITTGDDLLTISGFGYVGATNTYQEAARITFDSTGTISDSATGIGGIVRVHAAKVGAEPAEIARFTAGTTTGGGWMTLNEADANPVAGDLADGDEAAVYIKAGNICFAQNVGGTINFLYTPIDGSTNTWTADTTGP